MLLESNDKALHFRVLIFPKSLLISRGSILLSFVLLINLLSFPPPWKDFFTWFPRLHTLSDFFWSYLLFSDFFVSPTKTTKRPILIYMYSQSILIVSCLMSFWADIAPIFSLAWISVNSSHIYKYLLSGWLHKRIFYFHISKFHPLVPQNIFCPVFFSQL